MSLNQKQRPGRKTLGLLDDKSVNGILNEDEEIETLNKLVASVFAVKNTNTVGDRPKT